MAVRRAAAPDSAPFLASNPAGPSGRPRKMGSFSAESCRAIGPAPTVRAGRPASPKTMKGVSHRAGRGRPWGRRGADGDADDADLKTMKGAGARAGSPADGGADPSKGHLDYHSRKWSDIGP
jgi:hypothetical protein